MQFTGDLCGLTIENANEHIDLFKNNVVLQRSLLNTNNDVFQFAESMHKLLSMVSHCTLNVEIHGHICAGEALDKLQCFITRSLTSRVGRAGLTLYWSGHGRYMAQQKQLDLSMAVSIFDHKNEKLMSLREIVRHCKRMGPLLLVLECCHSGAAVLEFGSWDQYNISNCVLVLSSCTAEELSGAWVMDGMDTNGIMTKILIDPVGTYFKIAFQVFYDFGGDWLNVNTMNNCNHERELYELYVKFADCIIDEWIYTREADNAHRLAIVYIREHALHVYTLYRNYLLLIRYGSRLHMPQTACSFPDLSQTRTSRYWEEYENEMEKRIVNLWEIRSQK